MPFTLLLTCAIDSPVHPGHNSCNNRTPFPGDNHVRVEGRGNPVRICRACAAGNFTRPVHVFEMLGIGSTLAVLWVLSSNFEVETQDKEISVLENLEIKSDVDLPFTTYLLLSKSVW